MKRKLAAIAAAFLVLSACSAKTVQQETPTAPTESQTVSDAMQTDSKQSQTPAEELVKMQTVPSGEIETKPIEPEVHFSESFSDEPYEVQLDQEEVVSLSLTLPRFSLDSETVSSAINKTFEDLQANLQDYMGTTVYETAQSRHTIGFLEGSYIAGLENGILTVTYTVTERYADEEGTVTHENVYRFDTSTGARLDA